MDENDQQSALPTAPTPTLPPIALTVAAPMPGLIATAGAGTDSAGKSFFTGVCVIRTPDVLTSGPRVGSCGGATNGGWS